MRAINSCPSPKILFKTFFASVIVTFVLTSCNDEKPATAEKESSGTNTETTIVLPEYTLVKSEVDGKDAKYNVQVGDTLPNEQECIAIFRKVADIKEGPSTRNTAVYFTRAGFSPATGMHAYVMYLKDDKEPKFKLQSASNEELKKAASLTFDSIPGKKMIVECLEAMGAKIIIYQKSFGAYFKVLIFREGSYDIETMKAGRGNSYENIVLTKEEEGETFTYKEDATGTMIEVYNGENTLFNSYKILRRGE